MSEIEKLKERLNSVYMERNRCVAYAARLAELSGIPVYRARHDANDKEWDDDWRNIIFIEDPAGQLSWHYHDSEAHLFMRFPFNSNPQWDGHTMQEKYERMEGDDDMFSTIIKTVKL